jgi:predicted Zn-dependent protease
MKRWLVLALLLGASGAVLYYAQRHKTETRVGPEAVLNSLADAQRDVSRVPARVVRLSDDEEVSIGDAMAARYMRAVNYTALDQRISDYVGDVGEAVAGHARRKFHYQFHYVPDSSLVNAFALPGGHVFIGKGLIQLTETEDELASVLGHEVEHVDNYHCNDRVSLEARLRGLPLSGLVTLPVQLFQAGYSKEQELEADRDGTSLAVMSGYSPLGAIRLFQTFARLEQRYSNKAQTPDEEISRSVLEGIAGYFRSHPLAAEREAQIRQVIASRNWAQPPERDLRVRPEPAPRNPLPRINADHRGFGGARSY